MQTEPQGSGQPRQPGEGATRGVDFLAAEHTAGRPRLKQRRPGMGTDAGVEGGGGRSKSTGQSADLHPGAREVQWERTVSSLLFQENPFRTVIISTGVAPRAAHADLPRSVKVTGTRPRLDLPRLAGCRHCFGFWSLQTRGTRLCLHAPSLGQTLRVGIVGLNVKHFLVFNVK